MSEKLNRLLGSLLISLVLIGAIAATLNQIQAAPEAAAVQVVNLNSAAVTTSTTWSGGRWSPLGAENPPTKAEVWLLLDAGTANTTTFALQVSPDGSTWLAHSSSGAIGSALVADTNTYITTTIEGVYYRVVATATNDNTLTPTLKVVLR